MICPICQSNMIVVEHNKIELDYCTNCSGMWFDAGELELLLSSLGLGSEHDFFERIFNVPAVECKEKKRKCPICRRSMMKRFFGEHAELLIDICRQGDGLWFDGGELNIVIKTILDMLPSPEDSQERVLAFIKDTFKSKE